VKVTADTITDEVIRRVRDEARETHDGDRARCCQAALGIPTGDGALGLLNMATCRTRIAAIVENNLSCGLDTYGVGSRITDDEIRALRAEGWRTGDDSLVAEASIALGPTEGLLGIHRAARARCAAAWNTRRIDEGEGDA